MISEGKALVCTKHLFPLLRPLSLLAAVTEYYSQPPEGINHFHAACVVVNHGSIGSMADSTIDQPAQRAALGVVLAGTALAVLPEGASFDFGCCAATLRLWAQARPRPKPLFRFSFRASGCAARSL